jgi:signal peptidase I
VSERRRHRLLVAGWIATAAALLLGSPLGAVVMAIGMVFAIRRRRRAAIVLLTIGTVLAVAIPILFLTYLDGKAFRIPSGSMEPTLRIKDRVYALYEDTPERGELFVYHRPAGAEVSGETCGRPHGARAACDRPTPRQADGTFLGRVVGMPGDRLKVVRNRVHVNGARGDEPYVRTEPCNPPVCNLPKEITIPPDHYFMMGDNRGESDDSRFWGPVPRDWLVGRVVFRYWPLGRLGSP